MTGENLGVIPVSGTVGAPAYYEGPSFADGDVSIRIRLYSYQTNEGLVVGRNTNHVFTIDRPAKDVWPYVKDFNLWQNGYGYFYSGVVGDLEGGSFYITEGKPLDPNEPDRDTALTQLGLVRTSYNVIKVVPEHLIVIYQPIPEDGSTGGVSPGFHVIMLNEREGRTLVTFYTEHSARYADKTEEEALAPYRDGAEETLRKFGGVFIPTLKRIVYEGVPSA